MRPRTAPRLSGAVCCWLLLAGSFAAAAATVAEPGAAERGFPLIQTYNAISQGGETQNFGIARDPQGLLYLANGGGLLVYDGAWWREIPIGKEGGAFSVASDATGRVAVGGFDDFGLLMPDDHGSLQYVSLLSLLPPEQRELDQVMETTPVADGFLFLTGKALLLWDGSHVSVLARFPGDRPFPATFRVGSDIYLWWRDGLSRIDGRRIEPVPGGAVFAGRRVDQILPAGERPDQGLLVSVRGEGLFLFSRGTAMPFAPEASRWTAAKRLMPKAGRRLPDGRWALGSILGGLLLLRPDGAVDQVIDTAVGLPDNFITGAETDLEGSLWLALNNGLARVEVASPVSVIDRRAGLQGNVYALVRFRGDLWIATSAGLFTVDHRPRAAAEPGPPVRMREVPGLPPSVWSLLAVDDDLLVGTAFGLYRVTSGGTAEPVPGGRQQTVYVLARSRRDPRRIWLGGEDGLSAVHRDGNGWRFEGSIEAVHREVRSIVEGDTGTVWCGLQDRAVGVDVAPQPRTLQVLRARSVPDSDGVSLLWLAGRILAARDGRLLRLDEERGLLGADPATAALQARAQNFVADAAGNLWISSRPPAVALRRTGRPGGWSPELRPLLGLPVHTIEAILAEPDGVVWLAADNGLFRYADSFRAVAAPLPAPLLSRITLGAGTLVFGGAPGVAPTRVVLPPNVRHLRIEIGPLSFNAGLRYQTRIDPIDADWSRPTTDPFAELTRLPSGSYTFRVRTVGPSGEASPETAWPFRVRPPWYLTGWALALWMVAAVLLVIGYSRLRSRALRQRAALLEARVAEQTLELRHTVEELSRAHAELEVANERLEELSLRDELTGIANRRRLQQMLNEEWNRARRYERPLAFILLDLDHFKLLNDTRGHREGDVCLQTIAHHLAEMLRRTSDLVARYGGEELAVLLPSTDLAGALKIAEELRQGIEDLALPHEAAPTGHVTASFGVAAMVPASGQTPDVLVEAADLALYGAKKAGRNRVVAGDAEGVPTAK
ncbi:MAG TPA: diguanylate cyclase [Thermoanaerobaculia bacterium]|jgi:diguanylate cyclase (GGDEF)-like protein|nr:diguanylate cyclase [Thermoanaerobaculia bacterium]